MHCFSVCTKPLKTTFSIFCRFFSENCPKSWSLKLNISRTARRILYYWSHFAGFWTASQMNQFVEASQFSFKLSTSTYSFFVLWPSLSQLSSVYTTALSGLFFLNLNPWGNCLSKQSGLTFHKLISLCLCLIACEQAWVEGERKEEGMFARPRF